MPYSIRDYHADLSTHQNHWQSNWVEPYTQSYVRAWNSFKSTLDDQAKANQLFATIGLSMLTIGIGAGLGAAFGNTVMRSVIRDGVVRTIAATNSVRLMRAANWVLENPTRSFIVGEAWDQMTSILSDQTKSLLHELAASNLDANAFSQDPIIVGSKLREHLARTTAAAQEAAADIRDNSRLSEAQKNAHAAALRRQSFANPPRTRPSSMSAGGIAEKDMEIAMYMVLVLSKDYVQTTRRVVTGDLAAGRPIVRHERHRSPITTPGGMGRADLGENQEIGYDSVGSRIIRRVDNLYRQRRYGQAFFYGGGVFEGPMGRDEIQRAERTLSTISGRYSLTRLGPAH